MPNPKISTLATAFPGGSLPSPWYVEPDSGTGLPSGTVTVSGGLCALSGGTYAETGYYTSVNADGPYDLTSSAAFCRVVPNTSSTDYDTGWAVMASNYSDGYGIGVTGGNCYVQKFVSDNPTSLHTVTYNATSMAWMRIRESGGTIFFETAPSASGTWTTQYTTTTETVATWTAASSSVQLYYGSTSGSAKPAGTASFADFNTIPGTNVPLTQPRPSRHPAARKGASRGSPGAPYVYVPPPPPPAGNWVLDTTGYAVEDTAGLPVEDTSGGVPFAQPGRATAGRAATRRGAAAGSSGAPYVYVPVIPAPFSQPHKVAEKHPDARKGLTAGSAGAPYVFVPVIPAPWFQPGKGTSGRSLARRGGTAGSPGAPRVAPRIAPFALPNRALPARRPRRSGTAQGSAGAPLTYMPSPVQVTSGSTTGTTLTLTFPQATTSGNGVVIALCGYDGGSVSGITLGGVGGKFARSVAAGGSTNTEIWTYPIIGQSSTAVVITTSVGGIIAWAYEVPQWVNLDQAAGAPGTGTSWNSGTTAATIPYPHFTVGCASTLSTGSITPTASGWHNETAVTNVATASTHTGGVSGWRASPSNGTYSYSGTSGSSAAWGAVTASFIAIPGNVSYSTIWCGYQFSEHQLTGYTGVSATVTLPSTLPSTPAGALGSVWVGLGPGINQTGVYFNYDATKTGGVGTAPWSWWIPGAGERWDSSAWPAGAGDSLTFSVQLTAADWIMTITNNTRSWTYTEVKAILATNLSSWNNGLTPPYAPTVPVWSFPQTGAVVIIEKEAADLPGYGSMTVTGVTTTPAYTQAPEPILCINTAIDDYPGPFNMATGAFSFFFNANS